MEYIEGVKIDQIIELLARIAETNTKIAEMKEYEFVKQHPELSKQSKSNANAKV